MSAAAHLNLLRSTEIMSSSPVRLRVMMPILLGLTAVGLLVWWGVILMQTMVLTSQKAAIEVDLASKKTAYQKATEVVKLERDLAADLAQLSLYRHGCNRLSDFLEQLGKSVPAQIQLTTLSIDAPKPYNLTVAKGKPVMLGPKESIEPIALRLMGRTLSAQPVNDLLSALQSTAFTNQVLQAEIPRGSFRQAPTERDQTQELLLFDLNCDLKARSFE
ncbi:MAG: PilN domain-containing protein [Kiritimatiellia bacterium]